MNAKIALAAGFLSALVGIILPFLMLRRTIEPTYLLSFLSWAATAAGMFLGFLGSAMYLREKKRK